MLVGLNSLLEQKGSITLPTGEVIHRHPDAVVVVTTNVSYEGCRGVNQSVLDRMNLTQDIELPEPEIMAQRAMSITGCEDDVLVGRMVQVVCDMADYCRKNGISDGNWWYAQSHRLDHEYRDYRGPLYLGALYHREQGHIG